MRPSTVLLSLLSIALFVICAALVEKGQRDASSIAAMQRLQESTRTHYAQAVQQISTIQDSLNAIAIDDAATMRITKLDAERRLSPHQGDEVLARVAELRAGIQRTRERIESLEASLKQSHGEIAGFGRLVKQLKQSLAAKEEMVAQLSSQVDALQTTVAEANTRIAAQSDTLEQRRHELGTVYYAIGSKRDLMKDGIVVARGGVLGLGKTLGPAGTADLASFHEVDTDQETVIPIGTSRAQVLTAQPPASYSLQTVNGRLELHILDPHAFRQVRRLVIVTA
jgi:hypothetical protein